MELNHELRINMLPHINTPCYVFDESCFIQKLKQIKADSGDGKVCFSIKANPFLTRIAAGYVDLLEVCSLGELKICIKKNIMPKQIVAAGINKEKDYLDTACMYGVKHFVIESGSQMKKLYDSWNSKGITETDVALRLSIGDQFGMTMEEAESICMNYGSGKIVINGLHIYAGTQNTEYGKVRNHFEKFRLMLGRLEQVSNVRISRIVYGCGAPVNYFITDTAENDGYFCKTVRKMQELFPGYELVYELGRYASASCGIYITKVIERRYNDRTYIITDGGTHQLTYYNQMYGRRIPYMLQIPEREKEEKCTVCGSLCTKADIMVYDALLKEMYEGDYLIFKNAGAYTMTEGMQIFLSRELPDVMLLREKEKLVCIREKIDTGKLNGGDKFE